MDVWSDEEAEGRRSPSRRAAPSSSARSRRDHGLEGYDLEDLDQVAQQMDFEDVPQAHVEQPEPPAAIVARLKGGGRKMGDGAEVELARKKTDPLQLCMELFGADARSVILAASTDDGVPTISVCATAMAERQPHTCARGCPNKGRCYAVLGGLAQALVIRSKIWPPVEQRMYLKGPDRGKHHKNKGSPRSRRKQLLLAFIKENIAVRVDEVAGALKTSMIYKLRSKTNALTPVCKATWHVYVGVARDHSSFRKSQHLVQQRIMEQAAHAGRRAAAGPIDPGLAEPAPLPARTPGERNQRTFEWLAHHITHFSDPMPHKNVLQLHYSDWVAVHRACAEAFKDDPATPELIVGYRHFCRVRETHPLVLKAVQETVRRAQSDATYREHECVGDRLEVWKIECKNPRKNETFGRCKTCCRIDAMKVSASLRGDVKGFAEASDAFKLHWSDFMGRRRRHNLIMEEANRNPDEVLAICIDGIDKRKMQQPVLPACIRRDKDLHAMKRFRLTMVGAIAHGKRPPGVRWGNENRYLIFYDPLLGNHTPTNVTGAGANETLNSLMLILEDLKAKGLLPSSRVRRKLVLQVDNCTTNKNQSVIVFLALLVATDMFTETHMEFLLVGHTHVLVDQWFRVITEDMFTTMETLWTTPMLRKYLEDRFKCTTYHLDCFEDFKAMLDEFRATKITGHLKPYSFKFARREGQLCAWYQTSQGVGGPWYEMNVPLKTMPTTHEFKLRPMPLKPYESSMPDVQFNEDGSWKQDGVSEYFKKVRTKLDTYNAAQDQLDGGVHMNTDWLDEWDQVLADMRGGDALARRTSNPRPPFKHTITLCIPNLAPGADEPEMEAQPMTRARAEELALVPGDAGAGVVVRGGLDVSADSSALTDDYAFRLQHFNWKIRHDTLTPQELPQQYELVVWHYIDDNDHAGFAVGRVMLHTVRGEDPDDGSVTSDWMVNVNSYMPRGWTKDGDQSVCSDPNKFATADFAPELYHVERTTRRHGRSTAGRMERHTNSTINVENIVASKFMTPFKWRFSSGQVTKGGKIISTNKKYDLPQFVQFACEHWKCTTSEVNAGECGPCSRALAKLQRTYKVPLPLPPPNIVD